MGGFNSHRLREDGGFGITEVVVAAVILFMVLTAVLGLVAETTMMGVESQGLNAVSSAVNDYVERVRSLPFDRVAVAPAGPVSAETTVVAGYTVHIDPAVEVSENAMLKEVVLTVSVTTPSQSEREPYDVRVILRDYDAQYAQQYPPTIEFSSPTPPDNTVIAGYEWDPAGGPDAVEFGLRAQTNAYGREIVSVRLLIDGVELKDRLTGDPAFWSVENQGIPSGSDDWMLFPHLAWDSRQDNAFVDGPHTVEAIVIDSAGATGRAITSIYIDNAAPVFKHLVSSGVTFDYKDAENYNQDNMSGGPEVAYLYNPALRNTVPIAKSVLRFKPFFELAWDGNVVAPYHRLQLSRAHPDNPGVWVDGPLHDVGLPLIYTWPADETRGFGIFKARIWGYSGNPYQRLTTGYEESPVVYSTPGITGTYLTTLVDGNYSHEVTVTCDAPRFPVEGTTTYEWFWRTADYTAKTHVFQNPVYLTGKPQTISFTIPASTHNGWQVGCFVTFTPTGQGRTAVATPSVGWWEMSALPTPVGSGVLPMPQ